MNDSTFEEGRVIAGFIAVARLAPFCIAGIIPMATQWFSAKPN